MLLFRRSPRETKAAVRNRAAMGQPGFQQGDTEKGQAGNASGIARELQKGQDGLQEIREVVQGIPCPEPFTNCSGTQECSSSADN